MLLTPKHHDGDKHVGHSSLGRKVKEKLLMYGFLFVFVGFSSTTIMRQSVGSVAKCVVHHEAAGWEGLSAGWWASGRKHLVTRCVNYITSYIWPVGLLNLSLKSYSWVLVEHLVALDALLLFDLNHCFLLFDFYTSSKKCTFTLRWEWVSFASWKRHCPFNEVERSNHYVSITRRNSFFLYFNK